jgi:hypothetical protein
MSAVASDAEQGPVVKARDLRLSFGTATPDAQPGVRRISDAEPPVR